jgi:glycosyltransferase involved in cell wall biosynthesis
MRILLIAPHQFYVDRGTPIDVDILLRALSARGDRVDAVTYRSGEDRIYPGVTLHRAQVPAWLEPMRPGFSLKKLIANGWVFAKARQLVAANHYDIIHADEEGVFAAMWFKLRAGVPYVYDMDSSLPQQLVESNPLLTPARPLFNWCEAKAIRSAIAVAPVCNTLADLARDCGASHVTTLHDISQLPASQPALGRNLRKELGLSGTVLMYVGNLEAYQGVDLLMESFARISSQANCHLVIAGGIPCLIRRYCRKASRLGIGRSTHFIGPWPATQLRELLSQADILVSPRIRGIATPMKVFPYLHSGRPVLATALPTHTQILNESVCELTAPHSEAFGEAIIRLARDPGRRRRLSEAGQKFIEQNHTFAAHQQRVNELYSHIERELRKNPAAKRARAAAIAGQ